MPAATPALKIVALDSPRQNHLLAALDDADYQRLAPDLEFVRLPLGRVLCESGTRLTHVYFPTTSIVSMHYLLESGSSVEFAVTGNEGVVGISLFMGGEMTAGRAVVRTAGNAYRL